MKINKIKKKGENFFMLDNEKIEPDIIYNMKIDYMRELVQKIEASSLNELTSNTLTDNEIKIFTEFLNEHYMDHNIGPDEKAEFAWVVRKLCLAGRLSYPKWAKGCPSKKLWTAKLLDIYGYSDLTYIGEGSYNVVWGNKDEVFRVYYREDWGIDSVSMNNMISSVSKNDKDMKYIDSLTSIDNARVFKGKRAVESFGYLTKGKWKNTNPGKKKMRSVLHNMSNALKGVILIHSKGISLNDIKPDNFLKVQKDLSKLEDKYKKGKLKKVSFDGKTRYYDAVTGKKVSKKRLILSDLDFSSFVKDGFSRAGTPKYMDLSSLGSKDEKMINLRDMYALGISFIEMICRSEDVFGLNEADVSRAFKNKTQILRKKLIGDLWNNKLYKVYDPGEKDTVIKALELAYQMSDNDVKKRPQSYEKCLEIVNNLRGKNKN